MCMRMYITLVQSSVNEEAFKKNGKNKYVYLNISNITRSNGYWPFNNCEQHDKF